MEETQKLDGFLLTFEKKDFSLVRKRLAEMDYSPDSEGLKEMLLDMMEEPKKPESRIGEMLGDFVEKNPSIVSSGMNLAGALYSAFTKKRAGK